MTSAFKEQIAGDHYKSLVIQPIEYITKNKLDWYEGNVVKYISRHKTKGGSEDIKKVIHYATMYLEANYGIQTKVTYQGTVNKKRKYKKKNNNVAIEVSQQEQNEEEH